MKYCRHCGAQMQDEAKVCLTCGISEGTPVKKEFAYCSHCGEQMNSQAAICVKCGFEQKASSKEDEKEGKLTRVKKGKILTGVCAGIAKSKDINVWLVRLGFIALNFLFCIGTLAYIVASLAIPKEKTE